MTTKDTQILKGKIPWHEIKVFLAIKVLYNKTKKVEKVFESLHSDEIKPRSNCSASRLIEEYYHAEDRMYLFVPFVIIIQLFRIKLMNASTKLSNECLFDTNTYKNNVLHTYRNYSELGKVIFSLYIFEVFSYCTILQLYSF